MLSDKVVQSRTKSYSCHDSVSSDNNNLPVPKSIDWTRSDTLVWGIGRHGIKPHSLRSGFTGFTANDAAALEHHLIADMCNVTTAPRRRRHVQAKLIWLDTLVRTTAPLAPQECPEAIARFHEEMPLVLERACGAPPRVASIWDALIALTLTQGSGWADMRFDGVHWDMAANLLLAEEILDQMLPTVGGPAPAPTLAPALSSDVSLPPSPLPLPPSPANQ